MIASATRQQINRDIIAAFDDAAERCRQAQAQSDRDPVAYRYDPGSWPFGRPQPIASRRWGNP